MMTPRRARPLDLFCGCHGVFFVLLLLVWSADATAQNLRVHVSEDTVEVGDRFQLAIAAEHDFAQGATFPAIDTANAAPADSGLFFTNVALQFGDLEVLGRDLFLGQPGTSGRRIDSVVYEVTTFALDSAVVAAIPVRFSAGEDTFSVATTPQVITVASLVPPDASDIRPLAPLAEFPRPLWPWFLLALAAIALVLLLRYYLRERRNRPAEVVEVPPPPPIPPYEDAQQRFRALEQMDPTDPAQTKPFYIELADVLRTYLEKRVGVPALERTTRELVRELKQYARRGDIPEDTPTQLSAVLSLADLVKFADMKPPSKQHEHALAESRALLEEIEQAMIQRDRTRRANLVADEAAEEAPVAT